MIKPSKKIVKATEASHRGLVNTEAIEDGKHTFDLVKGMGTARRLKAGEPVAEIDNADTPMIQSGFSVFNPVFPTTIPKEKSTMAKAKSAATPEAALAASITTNYGTRPGPAANTVIDNGDGTMNPTPIKEPTMNSTPIKEPTKQELAQAAAKAKIAAKAAKKEEAEKVKAYREAAKAAKMAEREATSEQRKAAAEARKTELAALGEGRSYTGSMLALSQRVKDGVYIKSATGQLRSQNPLAEALDGVTPNGVIQTGMALLKLETNPYSQLNVGQQSMNLRNKMRGAIGKGVFSIEDVKAYVAANDLDVSELLAKEKADRLIKAENAKTEREAKAAAKAKATTATEKEAETA